MPDRYIDATVDQAIDRRGGERPDEVSALSLPQWVDFPLADTPRDVAHGMGTVPHGYRLVWADALVHASPGVPWTAEFAYLQSPTATARALLVFLVLQDTPVGRS